MNKWGRDWLELILRFAGKREFDHARKIEGSNRW